MKFPGSDSLEWWPGHVRVAFGALGEVLGPAQLTPKVLDLINQKALADHQIVFSHKAGKTFGRRKGIYYLTIIGPVYAGEWRFRSGRLEKLARAAAEQLSEGHDQRPSLNHERH